jgi:hypothetical protein
MFHLLKLFYAHHKQGIAEEISGILRLSGPKGFYMNHEVYYYSFFDS